MRNFFLMSILFLTLLSTAGRAETRYLVSLPDIPLMPQMRELEDSSVMFDKAQGRIIEETVKASGLSPDKVIDFYMRALPELGWTPVSKSANASRFSRNGEQLVVNLEKLGSEGLVAFAVSPIQP